MLIVVRHAESIENSAKHKGFYQDPRPYSGTFAHTLSKEIIGLTPRGYRQAAWLGTLLASLGSGAPTIGYSSTYRRAVDTASIALMALPESQALQTALLDEQHYGDATYMTKRELFDTYPDTAEERRTRKHLWTAPGGECLSTHVMSRAREFIDGISSALDSGTGIVAITHQTTIVALRSILEHRLIPDLLVHEKNSKTPNAAVFTYEARGSRFELKDVIAPPI